jgi:hypothetical protein
MKDDIIFLFFVNGRLLQLFGKMEDGLLFVGKIEDDYNFFAKWNTTSIFWQNKR